MDKPRVPADWDLQTLLERWHAHLKAMISTRATDLPFERLCYQSQADPEYAAIVAAWPTMTSERRVQSWQKLVSLSDRAKHELMPTCVRCGVCCEQGGPALALEDIDLVRREQIQWPALMTVRVGEPVRSNAGSQVFLLPEEKIKIREQPGGKACVLYSQETKSCSIQQAKPLECRMQACWDAQAMNERSPGRALTRQSLFAGVEPLLELIAEHERRCPFTEFWSALEALGRSNDTDVDRVLAMLAFDEHIRVFAHERLGIPEQAMDLIFSRCLSERVHLFGLQVKKEHDGTRTLLPLDSDR
ncbi:MAG: YkgJ family cysteine cluster protein [Polyangiaceae bacterium]|nr:YkgJ family cysteine cluster protein [Polyangiaceae bacterium]